MLIQNHVNILQVDELNEISKKLATFNQQLTEASAEFEKSNHLFKELLGNECE